MKLVKKKTRKDTKINPEIKILKKKMEPNFYLTPRLVGGLCEDQGPKNQFCWKAESTAYFP